MAHITAATAVFALWHSLLCSKEAKKLAKTWFGTRRGTAYYRAFFMVQAALTSGPLLLYVLTRPHRTLYSVKGWGRLLCWSGQGAALLVALSALRNIDTAKFTGSKGVEAFEAGEPIPEAEAQGPEIEDDGEIRVRGVFRYTRHPLEWAPVLLLFATPTLKTNWLAFDILATIYSYVGARHEEKRLLKQAGKAYEAYQRQVPFFVGWPGCQAKGSRE